MTRVRFGLRGVVWFAPNIAIFVGKVPEHLFEQIDELFQQVRFALQLAGQEKWAKSLVWERG